MSSKALRRQLPYLRGLKVVQAPFAGVDTFLPLLPPGVTLCDAQGVHDIPTAEWTVAVILAMQKQLPFYVGQQREGNWSSRRQGEQIDEVAGKTVLIVGYGSIGRAIESRLTPFGPRFVRVARRARDGVSPVTQLDELLPQADIVVIITPLTAETRHLMNGDTIARMKPGALLVNASRGEVVDTDALLQALNDRRIRAAIDVTDPEPLPAGHPLWKAPNLLLTPHTAGFTPNFLGRLLKLASDQAERFARGEPLLNVVTSAY
jgi:phosphoglycerate dehydrogenase-like enzyme